MQQNCNFVALSLPTATPPNKPILINQKGIPAATYPLSLALSTSRAKLGTHELMWVTNQAIAEASHEMTHAQHRDNLMTQVAHVHIDSGVV